MVLALRTKVVSDIRGFHARGFSAPLNRIVSWAISILSPHKLLGQNTEAHPTSHRSNFPLTPARKVLKSWERFLWENQAVVSWKKIRTLKSPLPNKRRPSRAES